MQTTDCWYAVVHKVVSTNLSLARAISVQWKVQEKDRTVLYRC